MYKTLVFALFIALFAIVIAYPASELEANNQELYNANIEGIEHDTGARHARQFGFGGYGGYGGFRRFGGFGGFGGGGFGGFGGGFGGFGGGFRRFGGFGGYYG